MTPQKAYALGVRAENVTIRTDVEYKRGKWVVFCEGRVLTEFHADDVFGACQWRAELAAREATA